MESFESSVPEIIVSEGFPAGIAVVYIKVGVFIEGRSGLKSISNILQTNVMNVLVRVISEAAVRLSR